MLKHVYNYQQQRNAASAYADGHRLSAGASTGWSPRDYSSPSNRSSTMSNGLPMTLPRGTGRNNEPNSQSSTPSSLSTISSSSADESASGRSSSGIGSDINRPRQQQQPPQLQQQQHATAAPKQYLTERETIVQFRRDHYRKPSRMAAIKIHVNVLNPAVMYTTLFVPTETPAKEMVKILLTKFRMRNRDANLFHIAMKTTIQDRATGGLPKVTHMKINDNERPLELNACMGLPGITIDFHLCSQPGGLVKIKNSSLVAGGGYKGLIISPKTTAAEVVEMMVHGQNFTMQNSTKPAADSGLDSGHNSGGSACGCSDDGESLCGGIKPEKPEDFDLYEICQFRKNIRPLRPDALPLLLQSLWSNPEYYSFELRRKPRLLPPPAVLKTQKSNETIRYWPAMVGFPSAKTFSDEDLKMTVAREESAGPVQQQRNCDTLPASVRKRDAAAKLRRTQRPVSSAVCGEKANESGSGQQQTQTQTGAPADKFTFDASDNESNKSAARKTSSSPISWASLKSFAVKSLKPKPKKVEAEEKVEPVESEDERLARAVRPYWIKRRHGLPPMGYQGWLSFAFVFNVDGTLASFDDPLPSPPPPSPTASVSGLSETEVENLCTNCDECRRQEKARQKKVKKELFCAGVVSPVEDIREEFLAFMGDSRPSAAERRAKVDDYVNYFYM